MSFSSANYSHVSLMTTGRSLVLQIIAVSLLSITLLITYSSLILSDGTVLLIVKSLLFLHHLSSCRDVLLYFDSIVIGFIDDSEMLSSFSLSTWGVFGGRHNLDALGVVGGDGESW